MYFSHKIIKDKSVSQENEYFHEKVYSLKEISERMIQLIEIIESLAQVKTRLNQKCSGVFLSIKLSKETTTLYVGASVKTVTKCKGQERLSKLLNISS